MLHLIPTSNSSLYLNLYSTKSYNKYCNNITAILLHYYNIAAIILQVFLHCAQNLILHIYYVVILLQHYVSIFLKRTFLHCCNVTEILQQYFAIFLKSCNEIFLQYFCAVCLYLMYELKR